MQKFDREGNFLRQWGSRGEVDGQFVPHPAGIITGTRSIGVDGAGQVYVGDGRSVQKFDAEGRFLQRFGGPGTEVQMGIPTDVTVDSQGDVWVLDNPRRVICSSSRAAGCVARSGERAPGPASFATQ